MRPASTCLGLVLAIGGVDLGGLGCAAPPTSAPASSDFPVPSRHATHTPARPLPTAIEISGLPHPADGWPDPVPTVWDDGAMSIRSLRLEPDAFLTGAARGEVVRVWAYVEGHERSAGRTWLSDRPIDRRDEGIAVLPPLAAGSGERVQVIARFEIQDLGGVAPTPALTVLAWAPETSEGWRIPAGSPLAATNEWPVETPPTPLLRLAAEDPPLELGHDRTEAMANFERAALADDGALAERHVRRAIELDPPNSEVWSSLIAIYHGYGQREHLLAALDAAHGRGVADLDGLWLGYGTLAVERGELDHALRLLARAVELEPDSLVAHFYLATARWLAGDRAGALPSYTIVVELDPGAAADEPTRKMLDTAKARLDEFGG